MNPGDFRNQYLRLCRGFNRERDVTDERLRALFDRFGSYEAAELTTAVNTLLCNDRFPSAGQLHAALEAAAERRRLQRVQAGDADAKRVMRGFSVEIPNLSDATGLRLYREACMRAWDNDISPEETSFVIAELARIYPFLWVEVDYLWNMGDRWRNAGGHSNGDRGQIVPVVHRISERPKREDSF